MRCWVCGSTSGARRFVVSVDDVALQMAPILCGEHGDRYLIGIGETLGGLMRDFRETGGSIPPEAWSETPKTPGSESAKGAEPPVLNKTGGGDVEGR